jgi:hypothetical protein
MRLHIASMALSLAIFTNHVRTMSAFTMRPLTTAVGRGASLKVGATESETAVNGEVADVVFPLKGKSIDQCAPRMRFAPSPTGR